MDARAQLCVSVFLSLCSNENFGPVGRLKTMLLEVDQRLATMGLPPKERIKLTVPLRRYAEEHLRVVPAGGGIAFFASPDFFRTQELVVEPIEEFVIDEQFREPGYVKKEFA
jgi:hypothetical protein